MQTMTCAELSVVHGSGAMEYWCGAGVGLGIGLAIMSGAGVLAGYWVTYMACGSALAIRNMSR